VIAEVASGKSMDRPKLQRLLAELEPGDVLLVWKLDRLGRSLSGVLATLEALAVRGVAYRSLSEPMIDSTKDDHLSRALVGVLAVFAQLERDIIRERVREGVAIAKAQGKMKGRGRPKALGALDEQALLSEVARGERTVSDLCRRFRISRTTYYRLANVCAGNEHTPSTFEARQCHGT
jgi:DNA invertase Pin-like site-specific DNA recombinase